MNQNFTLNEFEDFATELLKRITTIEKLVAKSERQPTDYNKVLLTVEEAAELIGVKISTMYAKNKGREIPYIKGGKILYKLSDIIEYLQARMIKSNKQIEESVQDLLIKPSISKRSY